jgi:hypothetical protein
MITAPCGACVAARHSPTLAAVSAGAPPAVTRAAAPAHCTVTQGLGALATLKTQPAIMQVSATVRIGAPALARGLLGVAITVPPCGHIIVLATVRKGGLKSPPARRY